MKGLVAVAGKHGATREIADEIGAVPRDRAEVDVRPAGEVSRVSGYDAVVLGSAVYMGHWLNAARTYRTSTMRPWPVDRPRTVTRTLGPAEVLRPRGWGRPALPHHMASAARW